MPALTKTSSSRPTPPWRPHNRNSPPQQGKGGNAAAAMTPACPKPTKNQSYAEPVQLSRPEYPSQSPTHHADTQISPITLKSSASKRLVRSPGSSPSSRLRATPAPCTGHRAGSMSEPPKAAGATTATGSLPSRKRMSGSDPFDGIGTAHSTAKISLRSEYACSAPSNGRHSPRPNGTFTPNPPPPRHDRIPTFTLRRAANNLETKRCLCGTWIKHRFVLEKKIPANLLD